MAAEADGGGALGACAGGEGRTAGAAESDNARGPLRVESVVGRGWGVQAKARMANQIHGASRFIMRHCRYRPVFGQAR